jgi:hypothetical protein
LIVGNDIGIDDKSDPTSYQHANKKFRDWLKCGVLSLVRAWLPTSKHPRSSPSHLKLWLVPQATLVSLPAFSTFRNHLADFNVKNMITKGDFYALKK